MNVACRIFPGGYVPKTDPLDYPAAQMLAREFALEDFAPIDSFANAAAGMSQRLFKAFRCGCIFVDTHKPEDHDGFSLESLLEGRATNQPRATLDLRVSPPKKFDELVERARGTFAPFGGAALRRISMPGFAVLRIIHAPLRPSDFGKALAQLNPERVLP